MLRAPPFFPPNRGEKPYLEVLSRFGLLRDFLNDNIQATISALLEIKQLLCVQSLILYYIKQMDSMLLCICPVIDHRWRQNVVRRSVTHSAIASCATFLSLPHLTSSVIYYWTDARQHGIYLLNGCTRETAKHERSVRVARSDSLVRL